MSKEYTVLVRRITYQDEVYDVRADSDGEAEELALEKAYNVDWSERRYESEYETEIVSA